MIDIVDTETGERTQVTRDVFNRMVLDYRATCKNREIAKLRKREEYAEIRKRKEKEPRSEKKRKEKRVPNVNFVEVLGGAQQISA